MSKKALYAGSFDPLTLGHLDIIRRASKITDELVVGVIRNPNKASMFSDEERMEMIGECVTDLDNVTVDSFSGLLADYVKGNGFDMVVRGLRNVSDFDSEVQMAQLHEVLYEDRAETIFMITDPKYSYISSSMVKEVFGLGGNIDSWVPRKVLEHMNDYKSQEEK